MKYFTPELHVRGQSPDADMQEEVDRLWEDAVEQYEQQLQRLRPKLPQHLRYFLDELLLHDADVWSLAQREDQLILVLRKDIPPCDVVILTYALVMDPVIDTAVLPKEHCSTAMQFMYNEVDRFEDGDQPVYTESILFSNGWEVQLRFRDVQVVQAEPTYPVPGTMLVPVSTAVPQSAE